MSDGDLRLNSILEKMLVAILNFRRAGGKRLNDNRHPVKSFESWRRKEEIDGVAGGATAPLFHLFFD